MGIVAQKKEWSKMCGAATGMVRDPGTSRTESSEINCIHIRLELIAFVIMSALSHRPNVSFGKYWSPALEVVRTRRAPSTSIMCPRDPSTVDPEFQARLIRDLVSGWDEQRFVCYIPRATEYETTWTGGAFFGGPTLMCRAQNFRVPPTPGFLHSVR